MPGEATFAAVPPDPLPPPLPETGAPRPSPDDDGEDVFDPAGFATGTATPDNPDRPATAAFLSEQQFGHQFNDLNELHALYEYESGLRVQTPMGKESADGDVVRVHSARYTKVIEWSYNRWNAWPEVPHPDTGDPNLVLLRAEVQPQKPIQGPNGTRLFKIVGRYEYAFIKPPFTIDNPGPLATATSPESTAQPVDNTAPIVVFKRGVLRGL